MRISNNKWIDFDGEVVQAEIQCPNDIGITHRVDYLNCPHCRIEELEARLKLAESFIDAAHYPAYEQAALGG